ncbi:MAG: TonB family protein [Kofleriaceae bacterium]|nr:TonB family protein [Kofleriaceae bacterium]
MCRALVDRDGRVREVSVYRSRLELAAFEAAAVDAVRAWRFAPARQGGAPVAAWVNLPVSFAGTTATARVRIKGSDTIGGALGPALAQAFMARRPDVEVTVEALGSATAFVGLLDGTADLGAASRPVKPAELDDAARLGVRFDELVLGYDGLALVVHPDNPIAALTIDEASRLFRGEITRWSELGGPDRPVHLLSRPGYSGTHDFFVDKVVRRGDGHDPATIDAGAREIEHSDALVAAVAADPDAIGYVGLGWVDAGVRAVAISPGAGAAAIAPSAATVRDGRYPIYRALLIYSAGAPRGAVADFLRFALSPAGQELVAASGFVPGDTPAEVLAALAADDPGDAAARGELVARLPFGRASATLSEAARVELAPLAQRARGDGARILVVGHADADGDPRDNVEVAARRARATAAWLIGAGVPRDHVTVESSGADAPVGTNTTAAGRDRNRRVDVFVTPAR